MRTFIFLLTFPFTLLAQNFVQTYDSGKILYPENFFNANGIVQVDGSGILTYPTNFFSQNAKVLTFGTGFTSGSFNASATKTINLDTTWLDNRIKANSKPLGWYLVCDMSRRVNQSSGTSFYKYTDVELKIRDSSGHAQLIVQTSYYNPGYGYIVYHDKYCKSVSVHYMTSYDSWAATYRKYSVPQNTSSRSYIGQNSAGKQVSSIIIFIPYSATVNDGTKVGPLIEEAINNPIFYYLVQTKFKWFGNFVGDGGLVLC